MGAPKPPSIMDCVFYKARANICGKLDVAALFVAALFVVVLFVVVSFLAVSFLAVLILGVSFLAVLILASYWVCCNVAVVCVNFARTAWCGCVCGTVHGCSASVNYIHGPQWTTPTVPGRVARLHRLVRLFMLYIIDMFFFDA